jgi:glucose/arabinose dehydrogenase
MLTGLLRIGVVAALVGGLAVSTSPPAEAAALAPGFVVRDMPSGQSELLTDFAFAPDGSYFTVGKNGRVAWVSAAGEAVTLATLPVVSVQDLGLSGVAVSHDFPTSRTIYLTRTLSVNGQWTMRLAAWTVSYTEGPGPRPAGLTAERVLFDLAIQADVHAMTGIVVDVDGTLWVSVGDAADFRVVDPLALRALDLDVGYGKILHVNPDGSGVSSNPFYDAAAPSSWRSRVYASGFRSPFRLSLDPATGAPIVGDVGWRTWEEVDLVRPGANYGWPCWEGDSRTPGYSDMAACAGVPNTPPLWTYRHGAAGTSITGGIVYTGSSYPQAYRGAYFFGDYSSQRVYTLRYDEQGRLVQQPEVDGFGSGNGRPVAFAAAENGDIVYADIGGSTLKRLVYLPGNRPPTAQAETGGDPATLTVTFDGSASTDVDGDALTYRWDFGDGATGTGVRVSHTYAAPGTTPLTASLTVTDAQGATGTSAFTVVPADHVPVVTLTAPPPGTEFAVGEVVRLSASATDVEDGPLPVTWSVVAVHCSTGVCHEHPGESFPGPDYARPFTDHGDETYLEIRASAVDSIGQRSTQVFTAEPRLRQLTVGATPPSAVIVNGEARASTLVTVGARVSVSAPAVAADGVATFERWTDGQPRERTLVMPDADVALEAVYLSPIDRRYAAEAPLRTLLGEPTSAEAGDASLRLRTYAGGRLYWTPASEVHEVHGGILTVYLARGGHLALGEPITDETVTGPDGRGRYSDFRLRGTSIYYSPSTGAHVIWGGIRTHWRALGAERSAYGYPRSSELGTADGRGRYTVFQQGSIYWTRETGAHGVRGGIFTKWSALGRERGFLRYPTTDERPTSDGVGRFNDFQGGSIFWSRATGAHEVHGGIRTRWRSLGAERGYLGYPTSDEFSISTGRRSNFQNGYITWNSRTGQVVDRRY